METKKNKFLIAGITAAVLIAAAVAIVFVLSGSGSATQKVTRQISLAEKYMSELDYENTILAYKEAIRLDPKCEKAYTALAEVYIEMGNYADAEQILAQAAANGVTSDKLTALKADAQKLTAQQAQSQQTPTEAPTQKETQAETQPLLWSSIFVTPVAKKISFIYDAIRA